MGKKFNTVLDIKMVKIINHTENHTNPEMIFVVHSVIIATIIYYIVEFCYYVELLKSIMGFRYSHSG